MKKVYRIIIIALIVVIAALSLKIFQLKRQIGDMDNYVSKERIIELAVSYNVSTAFLRKLFPNDVVYLDNGKVTVEKLNPSLKLNEYDYSLLDRSNGRYFHPDAVQGVDVSKFSGDIDWNSVKEAGYSFAMIRVGYRGYSEGGLNKDAYFDQNAKGCNEAGIHLGVYFFSQAISVEEAIEEASYVITQIKDYDITYPVCFDMEEMSGVNARANKLTKEEVTEITLAFCNTVKAAGYTPVIYANSHWIFSKLDLEQVKDIDKWYAQYASEPYYPYEFTMWQYSASGKVPGISNDVDLNLSFRDYSQAEQ